jgi:hypothetical protein
VIVFDSFGLGIKHRIAICKREYTKTPRRRHSSIDLLTFKQFGPFRKSKRRGGDAISLGFKQLARRLHGLPMPSPHRLRQRPSSE